MSGKTWVYSDPHFYHKNIVKPKLLDEILHERGLKN